jgi:hypothetical protein
VSSTPPAYPPKPVHVHGRHVLGGEINTRLIVEALRDIATAPVTESGPQARPRLPLGETLEELAGDSGFAERDVARSLFADEIDTRIDRLIEALSLYPFGTEFSELAKDPQFLGLSEEARHILLLIEGEQYLDASVVGTD